MVDDVITLDDAVLRSVELTTSDKTAAQVSSQVSLLLRPFSAIPLVQRILFHLALADGGSPRSRYVAEVLTGAGSEWVALLLAGHGLPSATKLWQQRKLEALLTERPEVPKGLKPRTEFTLRIGKDGVRELHGADGPLAVAGSAEPAPFTQGWIRAIVEVLRDQPVGLHRDLLFVEVDGDADMDVVLSIISATQILPITAVAVFSDPDQCFEVGDSATRDLLPSSVLRGVRGGGEAVHILDVGGRPMLELIGVEGLTAGCHDELRAFAVMHGALDLLTNPVLREARGSVAKALWLEHREGSPPSTDRRIATRLVSFRAAGKRAAELREYLSGCLLDAGMSTEALALLRDVPERYQGRYYLGRLQRALFALARFEDVTALCGGSQAIGAEAIAVVDLLRELDKVSAAPQEDLDVIPGKVMTILHASAPAQSGGYAVRAHGLLRSLSSDVEELVAYTRPGFPEKDNALAPGDVADATHDGVRYCRMGTEKQRKSGEYQYMLESVEHYKAAIRRERPSVVHLRSTYVSALPGLIAAKYFGLAVIYEVSGMWELVYEADHRPSKESARVRTVRLENAVLAIADTVVTITEAMATIISERVTTKKPVELVPNAVDVDDFATAEWDPELLSALGWADGAPVIGYIGSFVAYEGLDVYIRALAELKYRGVAFHALFVGDGAESSFLHDLADSLDLGLDHLKFTGRVPHADVARYAAIIDVFAYPRLLTPATAAVSPLKPFEAMAAGKAVVVSDVPALAEIVGNGERGRVVTSGSLSSLADALQEIVIDLDATRETRSAAQQWVRRVRSWDSVGATFAEHVRPLMR